MPCYISSHTLHRIKLHWDFKCQVWKHSTTNQVTVWTFFTANCYVCHMQSVRTLNSLQDMCTYLRHTPLQYSNTQQYHLYSSQNPVRSPMCYGWRNSPVKPHKSSSVYCIVSSEQNVCTFDFTMCRSLRMYCGCDPRRDFSLVDKFPTNKEIQIM
jgi:hypothetical protein